MSITTTHATLIRTSFAEVAKLGPAAGEMFYTKLFETAPSVRSMFPDEMSGQAAKLTTTLALVVHNISALETILPVVEDLGRRHVGYGVVPAHYDIVGQVLLATLREALGYSFTAEVEDAWATAYGALSARMIAVSYPEVA